MCVRGDRDVRLVLILVRSVRDAQRVDLVAVVTLRRAVARLQVVQLAQLRSKIRSSLCIYRCRPSRLDQDLAPMLF